MQKLSDIYYAFKKQVNLFHLDLRIIRCAKFLLVLAVLIDMLFVPAQLLSFPKQHIISLFTLFPSSAKYIGVLICFFAVMPFMPVLSSILFCWLAYSMRCAEFIVNGGNLLTLNFAVLLVPVSLYEYESRKSVDPSFNIRIAAVIGILFCTSQMIYVYYDAAITKIFDADWRNGNALVEWTQDSYVGWRACFQPIALVLMKNKMISVLLSYLVIILELMLAFYFLFNKKLRKRLFVCAVLFHVLIAAFHGLISFAIVMCGGLLLMFYAISYKRSYK